MTTQARARATSNERRSMISKYAKGAGLYELAETFGYSVPTIRRTLADEGVVIRGRGRPVLTA